MRETPRTPGTARLGPTMEANDDFGSFQPVSRPSFVKSNKAKLIEDEQLSDYVQPAFTAEPEAEEPAGATEIYKHVAPGSLEKGELVCLMHACGLVGLGSADVDVVEFHERQNDLWQLAWTEETKYGRRLKIDRAALDIAEIHALVGHCMTRQPNGSCRCREVELARSLAKASGPSMQPRPHEVDTNSELSLGDDQDLAAEVRSMEQRLQGLEASSETERALIEKATTKLGAARAELEELVALRGKNMVVDVQPEKLLQQIDSKKLHEELERRSQLVGVAAKFLRSTLTRAAERREAVGVRPAPEDRGTSVEILQELPQMKPCVIKPGEPLPQPSPPAGLSHKALAAQFRGPEATEEKQLINVMAAPLTARLILQVPPAEATSSIAAFSGHFTRLLGEVTGAPLNSVRVLRIRKQRVAQGVGDNDGTEGTTVDFGILAAPYSSGDVFRKIQHALQDPSSALLNNPVGESYFTGAELQLTTLTSQFGPRSPMDAARRPEPGRPAEPATLKGASSYQHLTYAREPPSLGPRTAKWQESVQPDAIRQDRPAPSGPSLGVMSKAQREHFQEAHADVRLARADYGIREARDAQDVRLARADLREVRDVDWKVDLHSLKRQCEANLQAMEDTIFKRLERCDNLD